MGTAARDSLREEEATDEERLLLGTWVVAATARTGGDWPTLDWVEDDWTRIATLDDHVR